MEIDGSSAYWAVCLCLDPLEQAFVMKKMPAGGETTAVKQLGHADYAGLVRSGSGRSKEVVKIVDEF